MTTSTPHTRYAPSILVAAGLLAATGTLSAAQANAATCQATSQTQQVTVVELYTSEGCDSCPPADRWLSGLKRRPDVLAAAFHVDYWDRLGWKDRFADPTFTARQAQTQSHSGAKFSYTPQVLVNGRDWRRWPDLPASRPPALVQVLLKREPADRVSVQVTPGAAAPAQLALWWAVLEDDHSSAVKTGENAGVTLRHDHVVRSSGSRPAWRREQSEPWVIQLPSRSDLSRPALPAGAQPRASRLLVVVTDAATGAPLQAVELAC